MPKQLPFTSTLPFEFMEWLEEMAKRHNTTKKNVILTALKLLREKDKKNQLKESFQRASQENDILIMSEDGLDDTLEQLNFFLQ